MNFHPKYKLWWPDFEVTRDAICDYMLKRVNDVDVAMSFVRTRGIAVQAGGHVGLFPRQLAKHFSYVFTFEMIPSTAECLQLNTQAYPNIITQQAALGPTDGEVRCTARHSGQSRLDEAGDITVPQVTIDSLKLPRCDLIYLDVEGAELLALEGAKETIEKFRPILTLEVLPGRQETTFEWARANNYTPTKRVHGDWIFLP